MLRRVQVLMTSILDIEQMMAYSFHNPHVACLLQHAGSLGELWRCMELARESEPMRVRFDTDRSGRAPTRRDRARADVSSCSEVCYEISSLFFYRC